MKNFIKTLISICFLCCLAPNLFAAAPTLTPELMGKLYNEVEVIKDWVSQPIIIETVKIQNAQNLSITQIKQLDIEWIKTKKSNGETPLMNQILNHPVGELLRQKNIAARGRYPEAFLCDNQGANVAVSKLTSDYWQGDEEKWIKSFDNGKGKVVFGKPEYDESTKAMIVQVSVPVMDQEKTIGVLVVGVKFSTLK